MRANQTIVDALLHTKRQFKRAGAAQPQWAEWYAHHLLSETPFQTATERMWTETDLTQALADLQAAYRALQPNSHWSVYFAQRLES
jgi:hypothetical protein